MIRVRTIAVLTAAAVLAAGCSAHPQATPSSPTSTSDVNYLRVVRPFVTSVDRWPDSLLVMVGRDVCTSMRGGVGIVQAIENVAADGFTPTQAGEIVGAANAAYCPTVR